MEIGESTSELLDGGIFWQIKYRGDSAIYASVGRRLYFSLLDTNFEYISDIEPLKDSVNLLIYGCW